MDVIPASQFSQIALKLQSYLPSGIGPTAPNNYNSANATGLTNWSTTDRIDYVITSKDTLTMVAAIGRQASSNPVGQTTAGRNVGPVPYNYGQAFAPKTAVGVIEETHIFTPHLVNQFKYGYARYNGPTFNANQVPAYAATAMGIDGSASRAGTDAFPIVTFAGTNASHQLGRHQVPTSPSLKTTPCSTTSSGTTASTPSPSADRSHGCSTTSTPTTGGSTPLTLANAVTETAAINKSSNSAPAYAATANTGLAYASFLIGQIDKGSFTQYLAAGVRRALPRHLALRSGQLEGQLRS